MEAVESEEENELGGTCTRWVLRTFSDLLEPHGFPSVSFCTPFFGELRSSPSGGTVELVIGALSPSTDRLWPIQVLLARLRHSDKNFRNGCNADLVQSNT